MKPDEWKACRALYASWHGMEWNGMVGRGSSLCFCGGWEGNDEVNDTVLVKWIRH